VKQSIKKLALRTERVRRLDRSSLTQVVGGKKSDKCHESDGNETTSNESSERGGNGGGSGHMTTITTLVHHQD